MKALALALATAAAVIIAQPQTITIAPHTPAANSGETAPSQPKEKRHVTIGVAILGYVAGPGVSDLHPIIGSLESPRLGDPVALPTDLQGLYLPPRQHYALLAEKDQPVSVWNLSRASAMGGERGIPIVGAISRPDLVAFSPRGEAAVLYSQASSSLQVVRNLPAQSSIARQLPVQAFDEISSVAVTDDAAAVIATFTDGRLMVASEDGAWRPLTIGLTPLVWSFVPKTHDLIISDSTQNEIGLLINVDKTPSAVRILALGVQADRLGVTKDGEQLVAASTIQNRLWTVGLKTGLVTPLASATSSIDSLIPLRSGQSFLLSSSALSALNSAAFANTIVSLVDKNVADQAQTTQGRR